MVWFVYNCLFAVVYALMLPRFFLRMWRRGGYRQGFLQRLGYYGPVLQARLASRRWVWIHAVSVGEMYVAQQCLETWRASRPDTAFVLTTATSTGHAIAARQLHPPDVLLYFPVDFPPVIRRVLGILRPTALVLVEGELWPNLIRQARVRGIPVFLLNGRLSEKSYRGYRRIRPLVKPVLAGFDWLCLQGATDARRMLELGAPPERVKILGSAKYDVAESAPPPAADLRGLRSQIGWDGSVKLLVGGSTWSGEEAALIAIYRKLRPTFPDMRLVLVPRHMERAAEVLAEIERQHLAVVRRRALLNGPPAVTSPDVLLVDTTGELTAFYATATVIFVGKSLTGHGGQNIIEPAIFAKPIVVGPHMENFAPVLADFLAAQALIQVQDQAGLESAIRILWADESRRQDYGRRARQVVRDQAGVIRASIALFLKSVPL